MVIDDADEVVVLQIGQASGAIRAETRNRHRRALEPRPAPTRRDAPFPRQKNIDTARGKVSPHTTHTLY